MIAQLSASGPLEVFDLLFVITAMAFNLLIAALFAASKEDASQGAESLRNRLVGSRRSISRRFCQLPARGQRYFDLARFRQRVPLHVGGVVARLRFQDRFPSEVELALSVRHSGVCRSLQFDRHCLLHRSGRGHCRFDFFLDTHRQLDLLVRRKEKAGSLNGY